MTVSNKISPALAAFRNEADDKDTREALVIYRMSNVANPQRTRGRLRTLQAKLNQVKQAAVVQKTLQNKLFKGFAAETMRPKDAPTLQTAPVGDVLPVQWVKLTADKLERLAEQDEVLAILPNARVKLVQPTKTDYAELQRAEMRDKLTWGLKILGIPKLWETTKGKDINVAVLDTGVYGDHSALAGRVKEFVVIDPLGRRIETETAFDGDIHGTHVCGTIAGGTTAEGVHIGVAPEANLLVGGVLIGNATLRTLFEGISWAVEKGADIISMSLGMGYYEPLFNEVFELLISQYGVLPIAAIGNENYGNSSSPGNVPSAFSVGAVEKLGGKRTEVTFFSSGASLVFPGDAQHSLVTKPDVVAPGAQVYSCIPPEVTPQGIYQYTYLDGTSMATPHVSGVAALLMAAKPNAPLSAIREALQETAKHPGGKSARPDNRWGMGLIQPEAALKALG